MPNITYEPISAKDALKQIKNLCSIMVDLAYGAVLFEDKGLADEVHELRDIVVRYDYLLNMSLQVAVRDGKDAQATLPLVVLGQASTVIANSATDIAHVLTKGFNIHPTIKELGQKLARDLTRGEISEDSILKGYSIQQIMEKMNYSITIFAVRHSGKWQIIPQKDLELEVGDVIIASGSGSGINLLKLLIGGTADEISPPEEEEEELGVESLTENLIDYLIALKDASEVMVDLAYGAVLYNNKELANLVSNMEKRVDTIRNKSEVAVLKLAKNDDEDISSLQGLYRIVEATEDISDAANQIAKIVLAELPSHPIIELVIGESDENIFQKEVEELSVIIGKTIPAGNYLDEFGIRVLAVKRAGGYYFKPRRRTKIRAGDTIIFTGLKDACMAFQKKEEEAVEVKTAEIEAAKKAAEEAADKVVSEVSEEVSTEKAKELAKKTSKEVAEKATDRASEKVAKKVAGETAEEVADKITDEVTKKVVSEVVSETVESVKAQKPDISKKEAEKIVKEATEAAAKKSADESRKKVKQVAKEAAEFSVEEKSDKVKKKVRKAVEKKTAEEVEPVVKDAIKIESEKAAKKAVSEAIKETSTADEPEKIVKTAATEAAKEAADKVGERAVERSGKKVAAKAAEEAALEATEKEVKKVASKAAKKAVKEVAEEVITKEVKEAAKKAAEEAAKKAAENNEKK